jgi:hypothetical protein
LRFEHAPKQKKSAQTNEFVERARAFFEVRTPVRVKKMQ